MKLQKDHAKDSYAEVAKPLGDRVNVLQKNFSKSEKNTIILVDQLPLRRAAVIEFLREWAKENKISIIAFCPQSLNAVECFNSSLVMAIVNLGAESIFRYNSYYVIGRLLCEIKEAPLVIFSDYNRYNEVLLASNIGVRGLIPSNTDPDYVLKALSFILSGGIYFPLDANAGAMLESG